AVYRAVALPAAKLGGALAVAAVEEAAVEHARGAGREVRALRDERRGERYRRPGVCRRDGEARHAPEIDGLHDGFLKVFETDFSLRHKLPLRKSARPAKLLRPSRVRLARPGGQGGRGLLAAAQKT